MLQNMQTVTECGIHPREREYQAVYRAYFFGPFRFYCRDQLVRDAMWRRNKARTLLKWFLLNPGKLCSADQFIDLFWPDLPPEAACSNLHVTMYCLRRLLEPSLTSRQESSFIHRQANNFYWFHTNTLWWTDVAEVQYLFDTARAFDEQADYTKASFYYRGVVSRCSLNFLAEDEAEEWLAPLRHHYEYIYLQALMRLIQIYQQRNELEEVLEYAYRTLALDPYCELAMKAIVDAHIQQGNVTTAMQKLDMFNHAYQRRHV